MDMRKEVVQMVRIVDPILASNMAANIIMNCQSYDNFTNFIAIYIIILL